MREAALLNEDRQRRITVIMKINAAARHSANKSEGDKSFWSNSIEKPSGGGGGGGFLLGETEHGRSTPL